MKKNSLSLISEEKSPSQLKSSELTSQTFFSKEDSTKIYQQRKGISFDSSEKFCIEHFSYSKDKYPREGKSSSPSLKIRNIIDLFEVKPINNDKVFKFLDKNYFLIKVVNSAYNKIQEIFHGSINKLTLEVYEDPEDEVDSLIIIVYTNLSTEPSLELLDKLEEEWFLDEVSEEAALIFSVTVRSA